MAALKNNALVGMLTAWIGAAMANPGDAISVQLDNNLSACIAISHQKSFVAEGILFAKMQYKVIASNAVCGCKSGMSAYTSLLQMKGYKAFLMRGNVALLNSGSINFPLAMDQSLISTRSVNLVISCAEQD